MICHPRMLLSGIHVLLFENGFRDHSVDPLGAVDDLRHVIVDCHAGDHIGLLARQMREFAGDEVDRLTDGDLHCLVQIFDLLWNRFPNLAPQFFLISFLCRPGKPGGRWNAAVYRSWHLYGVHARR